MSCGCNECPDCGQRLPAPPPCSNGESCEELDNVGCIVYNGDDFQMDGLVIRKGDRLDRILQKLMLRAVGIKPETAGNVIGVRTTKVTATSIELAWDATPGQAYSINSYQPDVSGTAQLKLAGVAATGTITGLAPNTLYAVQVGKTMGPVSTCCSSVILLVKTRTS